MTPDDPNGVPRPNPVVLRIKLRYDDVEVMVQRFAPNVGKSGLFLPTRSMQPIGAEIKFELRLANDQPVLLGLGRVKNLKEPDADQPRAVYGLGVELMRVTRESRDLILRMLERRRKLGIADTGVPTPADVELARRAIDDAAASSPAPVPVPEPASEGLMTSPRATGSAASARIHVVEPLAAEPPRKRRPLVGEVIESASGPLGAITVPGLDDDVDIGAALARARLLATGDLDSELDALREQGAAPLVEITIDAASAELARQLGGAAVRRDRSQRSWAVPPAVVAEPAPPIVEEPPVAAIIPEPMLPSFPDEDDLDEGIIERDASDEVHLARPASEQPIEHEVDDGQIDDEIHQLTESDFEDVEQTHVGANPGELEEPAYVSDPGAVAALADRLDAQLAEAEAEAGYEDDSNPPPEPSLDDAEEIADEAAEAPEEIEEFEILAEADADDADLLASHGELDITGSGSVTPSPDAGLVRRPSLSDFASRLDLDDESDLYPQPPEPGYYERRRNFSDELPRHTEIDPRVLSAGHALAQFDDETMTPDPGGIPEAYPRGDSEGSFTRAEDFDEPHAGFSPPHAFDQSDVIAVPPELIVPRARPPTPPPDDYDLETALEALDVDLDDISIPHASTELHREGSQVNRIAGRPTIRPPGERASGEHPVVAPRPSHPTGSSRIVGPAPVTPAGRRAPTDDGIVIDFDDDDE